MVLTHRQTCHSGQHKKKVTCVSRSEGGRAAHEEGGNFFVFSLVLSSLLSCLVLSCLVLSCLVLSCLVLSCLVLSCLVLSCLVLSCLVLSCLVLSCLVLSCLVLSCLVLSCLLVFSSLVLSVLFRLLFSLSLCPCLLSQSRHSPAHSVGHMSLAMVDHVPSNVPDCSFPARLYNFRGPRCSHSYAHRRSQSQFETRVTNRVGQEWPVERIKPDMSIPCVRATETLADSLTKGAFTTIQWKPLMRVVHMHPPFNVDVDRSLPASSCSAVSQKSPLAMSNACSSQRDFKTGQWKEKPEDFTYGVRSALWKPNDLFLKLSLEERQCVLRNKEAQNPTLIWAKRCGETKTKLTLPQNTYAELIPGKNCSCITK